MTGADRLGPQLPLALRYPPDQRFETWVDGASCGVVTRLQALASGETRDPVYVQGAEGSGKSHLLLATSAAAEQAGHPVQYFTLSKLRGHLRDAFEGLPPAMLVALDDVDAVAGDAADELALFDLHNRVRDGGGTLLYAARYTPATLPVQLPDLRSRLAHCTLIALPALDDAGRAEVLRRRAGSRGLAMDQAAVDWLLARCSRDLSDLAQVLDRLDRASLAAQRRMTVPFLRQVLGAGGGDA